MRLHDQYFAADARDQDWLKEVGKKGWLVLTKDKRIRHRTIERRALMKGKVGAFVLTAGNLHGDEMAEIFVKALRAISRFMARNSPPFIARVTRGGSVTMLFRGEEKTTTKSKRKQSS